MEKDDDEGEREGGEEVKMKSVKEMVKEEVEKD